MFSAECPMVSRKNKKADAVVNRSAAGRSLVAVDQRSSTHTPTRPARFRPSRFRMSEVQRI